MVNMNFQELKGVQLKNRITGQDRHLANIALFDFHFSTDFVLIINRSVLVLLALLEFLEHGLFLDSHFSDSFLVGFCLVGLALELELDYFAFYRLAVGQFDLSLEYNLLALLDFHCLFD